MMIFTIFCDINIKVRNIKRIKIIIFAIICSKNVCKRLYREDSDRLVTRMYHSFIPDEVPYYYYYSMVIIVIIMA